MAQGKKAFIVYTNWKQFLDVMSYEQKGLWFSWVMDYCNDLNPPEPNDQVVCMAIKMVQPILKKDLQKYEAKIERIAKVNEERNRNDIDTKSTRNRNDIDTKDNEIDTDIDGDNSNKLIDISNKKEDISVSKDTNNNTLSVNDDLMNEIFDTWNNQSNLIHHKEITDVRKKAIAKALKSYKNKAFIITDAIKHYALVLRSNYYFSYKWSLEDFLNRKNGLPSFTSDGSVWCSFSDQVEKNPYILSPEDRPSTPKKELSPVVKDFLSRIQ